MSPSSLLDTVIETLRTRGLVTTAEAPPLPDDSGRPWFVALLLGAAGWLAGLLLLIFVGAVFEPEERASFLLLGTVSLGAAWAMYRAEADNAFLGQLALAVSMAGQVALAIGLLMNVDSPVSIAAVLLSLQLAVLAVMPDRTARLIAALFACVAWGYLVRFVVYPQSDWDDWLEPMRDSRLGGASIAVAWLLTWAPPVSACGWLVLRESRWMARPLRAWLRPALSGILVAVAVGGFATEHVAAAALGPGRMGVDVGWWSLFSLLSIALSVFAAWCAFRLRNLGLSGLAIAGALLHLGRFYYLHGTSLLAKSAVMLGLGAVLVAGALVLRRASRERAA
jgi:hypothetical protein